MAWTIRKTFIAVGLITLLLVILTVTWVVPPGSSRVVKSAGGGTVTLGGGNFKRTPGGYDLPNRPWGRRLEKGLPKPLKQRLGLPQPVVSAVFTPHFQRQT